MDEPTKEKALEKVFSMTAYIAYPDELIDIEYIEDLYKILELDSENYLEAHVNISLDASNHLFSHLKKPVRDPHWASDVSAASVKMFYSANGNDICKFPILIIFTFDRFFNTLQTG